jgi:hypothetical protein
MLTSNLTLRVLVSYGLSTFAGTIVYPLFFLSFFQETNRLRLPNLQEWVLRDRRNTAELKRIP